MEGRKTGGRKAGIPNKMTTRVREAIEIVANELGGAERMVLWCQEDPQNERIFWSQIYPKLLPLTVAGDPENPLVVTGLAPIYGLQPPPKA